MNKPPVIPAAAAGGLALLAIPERVPDLSSALIVPVQQPVRRSDDVDETHAEEPTHSAAVQGQVQLPPPPFQLMQQPSWHYWDESGDDDSHWYAQENLRTGQRQMAAILAAPSAQPVA